MEIVHASDIHLYPVHTCMHAQTSSWGVKTCITHIEFKSARPHLSTTIHRPMHVGHQVCEGRKLMWVCVGMDSADVEVVALSAQGVQSLMREYGVRKFLLKIAR